MPYKLDIKNYAEVGDMSATVVSAIRITRTKKDIIKSYYEVGKIYPMMYRHGENRFGILQSTMNAFDFLFTSRKLQSVYKDLDSYVDYDILEVYRYNGEDGTLHIVGDYSVDLL